MLNQPYYFGCVGESGHYPFDVHYRRPPFAIYNVLQSFDGGSKGDAILPKGFKKSLEQVEGEAGLTYWKELDCTILAFWDRSVDDRLGSWSGFFLPGKIDDPTTAIETAKAAFPNIWQRFSFDVKIVLVNPSSV